MEATSGFEPLNKGFADLCLTTWLRRLDNNMPEGIHKIRLSRFFVPLSGIFDFGAGGEIRTRDFHLGKVTLYH